MNIYESHNKLHVKPTPPAKIEEEAKKTITNLHREGKISMNQLLTIQQAINQSPDAWISVEDRLPEKGVPVICCINNYQFVAELTDVGEWADQDHSIVNVHFWQPLPSPPNTKQ